MGNLTKLADLLPKFETLAEMNEHFRTRQEMTRPQEAMRMRLDYKQKKQDEADDERLRPPFEPDGIEKSLIERRAPIRPGILACVTEPAGESFCDGSGHMKIYWSRLYRRWDWHCFQLCPVAVAEQRLTIKEKAKPTEDGAWPKKKGRI